MYFGLIQVFEEVFRLDFFTCRYLNCQIYMYKHDLRVKNWDSKVGLLGEKFSIVISGRSTYLVQIDHFWLVLSWLYALGKYLILCILFLKMSKVSGLHLVKPKYEWDTRDKLTEIEQFKADCRILFEGPLLDLNDKKCAGLIVNWLGREATQILTSVEADINSANEVFDALEKVFRPESNQTLACFKFRSMKQKVSQTYDSYMSQLRLALPECK